MIRVTTLDATIQTKESPGHLYARLKPLRQAGIDLLCCQSIPRTRDGQGNFSRLLSETLGLTSSCFAAGRHHPVVLPGKKKAVRGLAMLTGSGVWVLNSGSFTIGETDEEEIVQFGLIRKNGASLLALNLHLAASQQARLRQLRELFCHPLLKDKYGAVVLCADRPAALPSKEWQAITARSNYSLHRDLLLNADDGGLLCLLTARAEAVSVVTVRHPERTQPADTKGFPPGMTMEFDIQRMVSGKRIRPHFPLSFREQWLGYKEHRSFA